MGLFNFFKPKWKHSNRQVRLTAVENMSVDDLETLLEIIREDADQEVRLAALAKIDDRESMELFLQEELPEEIITSAKERLEEIYTLCCSGEGKAKPLQYVHHRIPQQYLGARCRKERYLRGIHNASDNNIALYNVRR